MIFRPITIEDRTQIFNNIYQCADPICDLSFANLFAWSLVYDTQWAIGGQHTLVIRFRSSRREHPIFLCPFCSCDNSWTEAVAQLQDLAQREGYPLVFMGITPRSQEKLERLYRGQFQFIQDEAYCDYIYLREKLATLAGKKLQPKRNHINRFLKSYPNYEFRKVTPDDLPRIGAFADLWLEQSDRSENLIYENQVIHRMLDYYEALELLGGVLLVDDQIVAFSLASPITSDTYDIHIEKALSSVEGAYTMVNREMARLIPESYLYLNREEDLGLAGLRQAKESYQPELKLLKQTAIWRHPDSL